VDLYCRRCNRSPALLGASALRRGRASPLGAGRAARSAPRLLRARHVCSCAAAAVIVPALLGGAALRRGCAAGSAPRRCAVLRAPAPRLGAAERDACEALLPPL